MPAEVTTVMTAMYNDSIVNEYAGYEPPIGTMTPIDRITSSVTPEEFFQNYVAKRRPVIFEYHMLDPEWKGDLWTNQHLKDRAGEADVIVERRGDMQEATFGLMAPKVHMTYGDFISSVIKGNDRLYLTTQDLERFSEELDDLGMPQSVLAEPLKSFQDEFVVQPKLLGNLVPYQLSMWHGIAAEATSSGLHHDYHDNLYVLIRGRKRFRLFPPSAAPFMRTAGTLAKIHHNGLIVYKNTPDDRSIPVRSDGVPVSFLIRRRKEEAEGELVSAEEALSDLMQSDLSQQEKEQEQERIRKVIEDCEERIDTTMEEMLIYGCQAGFSDDDDDDEEEEAYYEDETDEDGEPKAKRLKAAKSTEGDSVDERTVQKTDHPSMNPEPPKMPDHFCDMSFPVDEDEPDKVFDSFPSVKQKAGYMFCEVRAGEMLYLPASWFHEVTSFSETSPEDLKKESPASKDKGHLAFNYWTYPPDNDVFQQPYKDSFWPDRWEMIKAMQNDALEIENITDDEESQ